MAILYVASEAMELKPFAAMLTGLRKLKWPVDYAEEGIWEGRRVMLAANGAGPKLGAQAVEVALRAVRAAELSSSRLEAVVSTGFCGALDPALRESQIVVASNVLNVATGETFPCEPVTADRDFVSGTVATQDRIAMSVEEKRALAERGVAAAGVEGAGIADRATAVDMEASGVAARARHAGLPFFCIKVVSDRADEAFQIDFNRMRTPEGRMARGKISLQALTHPNLVPHLLHLRRRTRDAAKALGEFLVSCRIITGSGAVLAQ